MIRVFRLFQGSCGPDRGALASLKDRLSLFVERGDPFEPILGIDQPMIGFDLVRKPASQIHLQTVMDGFLGLAD